MPGDALLCAGIPGCVLPCEGRFYMV